LDVLKLSSDHLTDENDMHHMKFLISALSCYCSTDLLILG
jgi:hypothetical protein